MRAASTYASSTSIIHTLCGDCSIEFRACDFALSLVQRASERLIIEKELARWRTAC